MIVALPLLIVAQAAGGTHFDERMPLPVIVTSPGSLRAAVSNPVLFGALAAAVRARSRTEPTLVDGFTSTCDNDLRCLIEEARVGRDDSGAPIVLWVSSRASERATRVSVTVLDTARVTAALRDPSRTSAEILGAATTTVTGALTLHEGAPDVAEQMDALIARELRTTFGDPRVADFEALRVIDLPADGWVEVAGVRKPISMFRPVLSGLRPGVRKVTIAPDGYEAESVEVEVVTGRTSEVRAAWRRSPTPAYYARTATFWGGAGVAAAGVAALAVGVATHSVICVSTTGEGECPPTLAYEASWSIGLMTGGAALSAGSVFLGDEYEWPWMAWVAGCVAFGATFAAIEIAR